MNPKDECVKYQYTGSLVGIHWLVDVDDWTGWNVDIKDGASVKYLGVLHLHMDLFGPVTPRSINHEKYTLVIVDAYSRYLIEAARTMLLGAVFSKQYWTEAAAIACYIQNRSTIVKRHLKTPYKKFHKRIPNINFLYVFGCLVYIHNHKDHLGKFDEKADDGYLLGYSLVSKALRVFNTRRQKIKETYHITFDESPDAIKFSKPSVDDINIDETKRYPLDEYLHPYEPSQRYQTNSNDVSFIDPYEYPEPVVLETESKHSNHTIDEQIIDNLPNTKYIQIYEHLSSPSVEDTSVHNTISIPNSSLSIPSIVTLAPQDKWSEEKHIELVNIIGNPGAGMLTKAMYSGTKEMKLELSSTTRYLKGTPSLGLWYPKCSGFDLKGYSDSDYAGCKMDKKSTSDAARCYANILWIKSQLIDYDIIYEKVPIFCDNTSAIAISNNPVLHSRTKHIDIRYQFIRDHILKGDIELHIIPTQYQLVDIFTKPLDEPTFKRLIVELGSIRGEIGITTYRNALRAYYLPNSNEYVSPPSLVVVRPWFATIRYNGEIGAKGTFKKSYLPPRWRLLMAQIIQCLGGKTGGLDQTISKDVTIRYCLANGVQVDFAKII
ncbi:retrovirus-related pol polyprotein from transposon TNT 1-94 [Tanacetum coccineum]